MSYPVAPRAISESQSPRNSRFSIEVQYLLSPEVRQALICIQSCARLERRNDPVSCSREGFTRTMNLWASQNGYAQGTQEPLVRFLQSQRVLDLVRVAPRPGAGSGAGLQLTPFGAKLARGVLGEGRLSSSGFSAAQAVLSARGE
jgi:hypothetical protein